MMRRSLFGLFLRVEKYRVLVSRPRLQHVQRLSELPRFPLVGRSERRHVPEVLRLQQLFFFFCADERSKAGARTNWISGAVDD